MAETDQAASAATSAETFPGASSALAESVAIMARLRAPGGCPWDREQTFDTIKRHTLEETYEVFDAIERRDFADLKDELGDLLLQVLFYAQMAADEGHFNIADVAANLNAKLIRRHPHIFADTQADTSGAVLANWEAIKREEKKSKPAAASMLDDVPRTMPATLEAYKLGAKAAKVGFDWPSADGLFAKLDEEVHELHAEVEISNADGTEAEFGDLLFTAMNLARHLNLDAETALRRTNAKFRTRFAEMERMAGGPAAGAAALEAMSADELEALWLRAKSSTRHTEKGAQR